MEWGISMHEHATRLRVIGFLGSLVLTLIAYFIIVYPEVFHFSTNLAIAAIFTLALCQATVQLVFFLDIWGEEGPPWNLGVFISTAGIVFIIVAFSIWIMGHLNTNMM